MFPFRKSQYRIRHYRNRIYNNQTFAERSHHSERFSAISDRRVRVASVEHSYNLRIGTDAENGHGHRPSVRGAAIAAA